MTQYADGMASSNTYGFKNKIIGGDFTTNPWQRGTTFAALVSGSYSADRFRWARSGATAITMLKTADAPTAAQAGVFTQHCLHVDVTTADTALIASDYACVQHPIEGLNAASFGFGQAGTRYITLSFWVKSTRTGIFCVSIENAASNRICVREYTINVSDTWEKKTVTFTVDTSGTWLYDTGAGMWMVWALAAGSTYNTATDNVWSGTYSIATTNQVNGTTQNDGTTPNDFKLALIQLEAGSTPTPFEARDVGDVLRQCQRYLPVTTRGMGQAYASNALLAQYHFPVPARTAPTGITLSSTAGNYQFSVPALTPFATGSSATFYSATTTTGEINWGVTTSPYTAGQAAWAYGSGSHNIRWEGCEL